MSLITLKDKICQNISCFGTTFKTIRRNLNGKKFESEVFVLSKFIKPGAVCFDVGAAYGRYALNMSRLAGDQGQIYCFEPGTYSHKVLSNAVWFHKLQNVRVIKKGLSNKIGQARFTIPVKKGRKIGPSLAHLSVDESSNGLSETIELTTLDEFCKDKNITRLDFIKCDVEGAEMLFFQGAEQTINTFKPALLCEVETEHLKKFGHSTAEVYTFFNEKGYNAYILKNETFSQVESLDEGHNYFFVHQKAQFANEIRQ